MAPETEYPRNSQNFFEKAKEAFDLNNLDYCIALLQNILQTTPDFHKARSLLRISQLKKCEGLRSSWIKKSINVVVIIVPLILAKLRMWGKNWLSAVQSLESTLKVIPAFQYALRELAQCALKLGWRETAVDTLEILKTISPANSKILIQLAQLYKQDGFLEKSKKHFEGALQLSPEETVAFKGLKDLAAMKTIEKGGWANTSTYRDKIRDQEHADLLEKEARIIKDVKDLIPLIQDFERKIQNDPENTTLLKELSLLYEQNQQWNQALKTYNTISKLLPFDQNIQNQISKLSEQQLNEELGRVKNELALHPQDLKLSGQLKDLESRKKDATLSGAKLRADRYPNNLIYRYELGVLYFESGLYQNAVQELQNAVKDPQRRNKTLYYLGLCFKELKFFDLAEKQFQKVLEEYLDLDNFKKDVIYDLGLVYEAMDQIPKAITEYKKIFEVDIGYKDVAKKIQKAYP